MSVIQASAGTQRSFGQAFRPCPEWRTLGLLIVGIAALLSACSPARTFEARDVLSDIAAGAGPSRLKDATAEPRRHAVAYRVAERLHEADIYEPARPSGAGLVLVAGLAPEGKDDPRLVAFARTLARARFRVLVPDIPTMRAQKARPSDIREIADAVAYLGAQDDLAASPSEGLIAVSYAVGPAVLAALEPDTRNKIAFITAIGGYYDIEAVVTFFTTGYFQEPGRGEWSHRTPNEYGKWVFALSNADRLRWPRERDLIQRIAKRKMANPDADVADLAAALGEEGRAVYDLLTNKQPQEVPRLIAELPEAIRVDMQSLDLRHHDLSAVPGQLILVHGRDDPIIPYTESERLAAALPDKSSLYLAGSLTHVELGVSGLWDMLTLLRAVYELLEERDAIGSHATALDGEKRVTHSPASNAIGTRS